MVEFYQSSDLAKSNKLVPITTTPKGPKIKVSPGDNDYLSQPPQIKDNFDASIDEKVSKSPFRVGAPIPMSQLSPSGA